MWLRFKKISLGWIDGIYNFVFGNLEQFSNSSLRVSISFIQKLFFSMMTKKQALTRKSIMN